MLQIGSLVDNKYKILSEVGHGGMSVVYLAINERANKTWAVKEIRKDGVCDFEAVKQGLVVETDMLKKLNHPYLPSIIDVIDTEDSFLIVMDYIEGKSLQSVLKNGGAQPQELVVKWSIQLCDVLGYLHSREPAIIYRDMKPANVMLKPSGDITLIDFGTAREFKNRSMVEDTTCLGTRGYAAPEQFGGRGQTDARTDIYCLGATMYHLITGHSPAEPPYEIKPLSYWDPAFYGTGLEQIIAKCCQQDPAHRYQSCAELMYDLEHVGELDYVTQSKRKKKWTAFVASVVVGAVGLAGMVGFNIAKNSAMKASYDHFIGQAKVATQDFGEFVGHIKTAINVDPSKYDAYDVLLSRIEQDGKLDKQSEWSAIVSCLGSTGKDRNQTNEQFLLGGGTDEYADIQFRVGKLLFLMANDSKEDLRQASPYFRKALNEGQMADATDTETMQKVKIAENLAVIGESIDLLNSGGNAFVDREYTYVSLWDDLTELINNNTVESMGSRAYGSALYRRAAYMISDHYMEFYNEGVTVAQMIQLLDTIDAALMNIDLTPSESSSFGRLIEEGIENVKVARQKINGITGGAG